MSKQHGRAQPVGLNLIKTLSAAASRLTPLARRASVTPPVMPRLRPDPAPAQRIRHSIRHTNHHLDGNAVLKPNWPAPMCENLFRDDFAA